jgi:hypothetical protein
MKDLNGWISQTTDQLYQRPQSAVSLSSLAVLGTETVFFQSFN